MKKQSLASSRLSSLDAFRGLTIAGMIVVNNPASWQYVYPPLRHAQWHGWTLTDFVFPFFLFIVGVSISLALSKGAERGLGKSDLYFKVIERSLIIFALGIFLHLIPRFDFGTLRIPGVLQRIALCYFFSAFLFLHAETKARAIVLFSILAAYWLIMEFVPVPGYGAGVLDYKGNLCAYIDTKLLAGHLYQPDFDPEGLLSTLPAIATTLLGTLAGDWLRSKKGILQKTAGLFVGGAFLTILGLLLHPYFPINKQLWTSTYVLFTAGAAMLLLGVFFVVMEGLKIKNWATPFLVLGTNAITVFVGSTLMVKLIFLINVRAAGQTTSIPNYLYSHFLSPLAGPYLGSLLYPLLLLLIWIGIMIPLYKNKIFIKI